MNTLNVTPEEFNEMKTIEYDTSMFLTYIHLKFGFLCGPYKVVVRYDIPFYSNGVERFETK